VFVSFSIILSSLRDLADEFVSFSIILPSLRDLADVFDFFVFNQDLHQYGQGKSAPICEICGELFSEMIKKILFSKNSKQALTMKFINKLYWIILFPKLFWFFR